MYEIEQIEKLAKEYAEEQNSAYTNDYYGFIAGFKKAFELNKDNKKLIINLNEYDYKCGDGCCDHYGVITMLNGIELPCHNIDAYTILKQVLEQLGYDVEITQSYNG